MADLVYNYTDNGFCRVYYTWKNPQNQKIDYCAQDEGGGHIIFYRCSGGPYNEPDYEVRPLDAPPLSPGDESTDRVVNEWIKNKWHNESAEELIEDIKDVVCNCHKWAVIGTYSCPIHGNNNKYRYAID